MAKSRVRPQARVFARAAAASPLFSGYLFTAVADAGPHRTAAATAAAPAARPGTAARSSRAAGAAPTRPRTGTASE